MSIESVEILCITCAHCKIPFWITKAHQRKLTDSHETFYCPSGHANVYNQQTEEERAKKLLEEEKKSKVYYKTEFESALERENKLVRQVKAYKGIFKKKKLTTKRKGLS